MAAHFPTRVDPDRSAPAAGRRRRHAALACGAAARARAGAGAQDRGAAAALGLSGAGRAELPPRRADRPARCWPTTATGSSSSTSTSSSSPDVARTQAERVINEGAHCIVGAFDSGCTLAIAQVCEQRQVPLVVNIAAAPQITEQGYKFLVRNFPTGGHAGHQRAEADQGPARRHQVGAQERGVPARQRHLRHGAAPGAWTRCSRAPACRSSSLESIAYDPQGAGPVGRGHQDPRAQSRAGAGGDARGRRHQAGARHGAPALRAEGRSSRPARPASTTRNSTRRSGRSPTIRSTTCPGPIRRRR